MVTLWNGNLLRESASSEISKAVYFSISIKNPKSEASPLFNPEVGRWKGRNPNLFGITIGGLGASNRKSAGSSRNSH
ncbi:hypothetical protein CEXT_6581 [Caerostris extrusa]|uniref:Uncharacterized protein n=1 Tax=Caerostris extrusa TaxID=172846 RepID=A0AAV4X6G3_CAEEX|nr:hypothetical protein CEXT_6581 [Caerostris extrusa]